MLGHASRLEALDGSAFRAADRSAALCEEWNTPKAMLPTFLVSARFHVDCRTWLRDRKRGVRILIERDATMERWECRRFVCRQD
jgi:hypothetical protein